MDAGELGPMSETCDYCPYHRKKPAVRDGLCQTHLDDRDHVDELMAEFEGRSRGPILQHPECRVDVASGPPVQLEMEGV